MISCDFFVACFSKYDRHGESSSGFSLALIPEVSFFVVNKACDLTVTRAGLLRACVTLLGFAHYW